MLRQYYYYQYQAFQKFNISIWTAVYIGNFICNSFRAVLYILCILVIIFYYGFPELDSPFIISLLNIKVCGSIILHINYNPICEKNILKFIQFCKLFWSNNKLYKQINIYLTHAYFNLIFIKSQSVFGVQTIRNFYRNSYIKDKLLI